MPTWESELRGKAILYPYNATQSTTLDVPTTEADVLTFTPPTYFAYVEGVRLNVNNPSTVGVTVRIKGVQGETEKLLAEVTVNARSTYQDWLRWAYDALDQGVKFDSIKITAVALGATATGVTVEAQVTGVYPQ